MRCINCKYRVGNHCKNENIKAFLGKRVCKEQLFDVKCGLREPSPKPKTAPKGPPKLK